MPDLVTSHSNPIIKQVRSLRQRKGRDEAGLFLVEGIHPVGEAVAAGWGLETLIYSPDQLTSDFAASFSKRTKPARGQVRIIVCRPLQPRCGKG